MSTIKLALSGCGDIAERHCQAFTEAGFDFVAAFNPTSSKAEKLAAQYGQEALVYDSYEAMLKHPGLEAVVIAGPPHVHCEQCVAALEAGKHVLCEKPSCLNLEENDRIIAAQQTSGKQVLFFSARMRGGYSDIAKQYIDRGDLGDIYRVEVRFSRTRHRPGIDVIEHGHWFTDKHKAGGGILFDMGQYLLDQVMHLLDWPAIGSVSAQCFQGYPQQLPADRINNVEEQCNVFARLAGGIALSFDLASYANQPDIHQITILGSKAGLRIQHGEAANHFEVMVIDDELPTRMLSHKAHWDAKAWSADLYGGFARLIQGEGQHPGTSPEQARVLTKFCLDAYRAAEQQAEVICA